MTALIQQQPLADIEYISIADAETLDELDRAKATGAGFNGGEVRQDETD